MTRGSRGAAKAAVLAFDPGGVTGWAYVRKSGEWEAGLIEGDEWSQIDTMLDLVDEFVWGKAEVGLTCEDFILRIRSRARNLLSPVRLTATLEYELYRRSVTRVDTPDGRSVVDRRFGTTGAIIKYSASDAKSTVTDARLQRMGLWFGEHQDRHARDALRHAVLYLRRN